MSKVVDNVVKSIVYAPICLLTSAVKIQLFQKVYSNLVFFQFVLLKVNLLPFI